MYKHFFYFMYTRTTTTRKKRVSDLKTDENKIGKQSFNSEVTKR